MPTKHMIQKHTRELSTTTSGIPASDGDGVKMTRIIGSPQLNMLDPFLLLDAFESDSPDDYIGGFPSHPHRGFETVTYMLAGSMRHKDNTGAEGVIEPLGVQWMTAGKGIVHSEMPEQTEGLMKGFQLWVNLPKKAKMSEPDYQQFTAAEIAEQSLTNGGLVRVIAGETNEGSTGPVSNHFVEPTFMDINLPNGGNFEQTLRHDDNAFIYVIEGGIIVGDQQEQLPAKHLGILTRGNSVNISAPDSARFLLVAGKPLNETVARGGPFVMNTKEEIRQAFSDFQNNRF